MSLEKEKAKTAAAMDEFRTQKDAIEKRYNAFASQVEERIPQGEPRCLDEKQAVGQCYTEYTQLGGTDGVHHCAGAVKAYTKCVSDYGWRWAEMHMQLEKAQKSTQH
eukprot:TRINITY_DN9527_c0_g1_i1.p3 TRINITY_DN9527_c0_g1~~TRINITY_DN9527_c0_g1_i1.p3  ORF type:complete len:107 (+),score=41.06 TRINITY_DN9527_c0_g1_i1:121-441(+)